MTDVPPALLDVLTQDCIDREGTARHMYLDTRGYVTTGIGKLLRSSREATELPFRMGDRPATAAEISLDFVRVQSMVAARPAPLYLSPSSPLLPPDYPAQACREQIVGEFFPGLRRILPEVDGFPVPAVRALVALAYAMGVSGLAKFTHLVASCNRGDWLAASQEAHMSTAREETNERNAAWLRAAGQQSS